MGALHDGHLSLIARSVAENRVTCASIFVNPLQFDNPDDLEKYPRNLHQDVESLEKAGCDMVFTATLGQFFPEVDDPGKIAMKSPGFAGQGLEGESRPGHLAGVATIVERLFKITGSCRAYFGEKDYQQTLVVRHLAQQLENAGEDDRLDIVVVTCPTVREDFGLAMSSRNQRLSPAQKQIAGNLYKALSHAKVCWQAGIHNPLELETRMRKKLMHPEISIEYIAVRDQERWTKDTPHQPITHARALLAATIGGVRLIDNLYLGSTP